MTDIFDLTDLTDLPEKVRQQVAPKPKRERAKSTKRSPWVADLIALAGRPLSLAELVVARVRTTGHGSRQSAYSAAQAAIKAGLICRIGPRNDRKYELIADQEEDDAA